MTEQTLSAWLDGGLTPERRREVTRWMLRCDDPALPVLMQGLIRRQAEARADATLLRQAPGRDWMVRAWASLLEARRAAWSVGEGRRPALAMLAPGGEPLSVHLEADGVLRPTLSVGPEAFVALVVTTDRPSEDLLVGPVAARELDPDALPGWLPEPGDGRVTFWLAVGAAPLPSSLEALAAGAAMGALALHAVRRG